MQLKWRKPANLGHWLTPMRFHATSEAEQESFWFGEPYLIFKYDSPSANRYLHATVFLMLQNSIKIYLRNGVIQQLTQLANKLPKEPSSFHRMHSIQTHSALSDAMFLLHNLYIDKLHKLSVLQSDTDDTCSNTAWSNNCWRDKLHY